MRALFLAILSLASCCAVAQDSQVLTLGDSLIVRDTNIATNPFNFGQDPLTYLSTRIQPKPKITFELYNNRHVDNKIDTAFTLEFGNDKFVIFKWSGEENGLVYAELTTDKFSTKHEIKVGMTTTEVVRLLQNYDVQSIPRYLILENSEIIEYLKVEFIGDTVTRISFQGYMD